ncbi:GNAT superfamily N-acetyltransferase [Nonomuraea thailandensis]|uniref:GNAT superfamily N-acetyltransferase n=1 Tax=Nonomuraea thailandensis TaxID=1188745 RepID=A0A9X2K7H9_9ACTN|nr:GNAT family N-acetyltransferase [Nonomuraea thailandensis]MCP2363667.1 GNAT superfamily N-acetyltransferase [Nonomuraea thailandensis]
MEETFRTGRAEAFGPWPVTHRESGAAFALRPAVRLATADDAQQVAELIATAFAGLRPMAYLVPDRRERHRVIAANFRIFVEHAVEHGEIHLIDDGPAVAVWFPYTSPLPAPHDYDRRLSEATGAWAERFRTLDELFEQNHPAAPHHHLAFLAVHPERQNEGLGTALLHYQHARLAGLPAYLEASDPRNRDLYARHGYQARAPFALPDGALFWPMWRPGADL